MKLSYVSQTTIDKVLAEFLTHFDISQELLDSIKGFIKEIHDDKNDYQEKTEASINRKIEKVNIKMSS